MISIVTPVYNGAAYLDELIRSVANQDYRNFEHIVIDDRWRDGGATVEVLRKYPHLRWWTRPNKGQYSTLNEGIEAASGDLLCIISADDAFFGPDVFSQIVQAWRSGSACNAIYGRTVLMDSQDQRCRTAMAGRTSDTAVDQPALSPDPSLLAVRQGAVPASAPASLRHFTALHGKFWDWINRIIARGRMCFIDSALSKYRLHPEQTRQATARERLVAEDRLVLARHGSSYLKHLVLINYFRAKKLVLILARDGPSAATTGLRRFLQRR